MMETMLCKAFSIVNESIRCLSKTDPSDCSIFKPIGYPLVIYETLACFGDCLHRIEYDCISICTAATYIISHVPVRSRSSPGPPRPVHFMIISFSIDA